MLINFSAQVGSRPRNNGIDFEIIRCILAAFPDGSLHFRNVLLQARTFSSLEKQSGTVPAVKQHGKGWKICIVILRGNKYHRNNKKNKQNNLNKWYEIKQNWI